MSKAEPNKQIDWETSHTFVMADSQRMNQLDDESIHLACTSPPYFNTPHHFEGFFKNYSEYLKILENIFSEMYRVLQPGRIAVINCDDMRVDGILYPIVADIIRIMREVGFNYRDRILWKKPEGYLRVSRRSGVLLQNPYPMYYYPDNLFEWLVIFQKGKFNYQEYKRKYPNRWQRSRIDIKRFQKEHWFSTIWKITNVLPKENEPLKKRGITITPYPKEIPFRFINLFSFIEETVLDPFAGWGTTNLMAYQLGRNSVGYEIDLRLREPVEERLHYIPNLQFVMKQKKRTAMRIMNLEAYLK